MPRSACGNANKHIQQNPSKVLAPVHAWHLTLLFHDDGKKDFTIICEQQKLSSLSSPVSVVQDEDENMENDS